MKLIIYIAFLLFFSLVGCWVCKDTFETESLPGGIYTSKTISDCFGKPKQYLIYSAENENSFIVSYDSLGSPEKPIEGHPWIQVIWNKTNFSLEDSLLLKFLIPSPPELNVNFSAKASNLKVNTYHENGYYHVNSKLTNNSELSIVVDYEFNDRPWFTFTRTYTIEL